MQMLAEYGVEDAGSGGEGHRSDKYAQVSKR